MKTLLSPAALVFAILAVTAANPVGETKEVEISMSSEMIGIGDDSVCFSFTEVLSIAGSVAFGMESCYPADNFVYEVEYSIDTYTTYSVDFYSVEYGAQACDAPLYSNSNFDHDDMYYHDHDPHSMTFGPSSGYYASFRPKIVITCYNTAHPCYLVGSVCFSATRTSYPWWIYLFICIGALLVVAVIVIVSVAISKRVSRKKASSETDSDREPLNAQQQYPSYTANQPMGYSAGQPPIGDPGANVAYPPTGSNPGVNYPVTQVVNTPL